MKERTIQMEELSLQFTINENNWQLQLPKSQTRVKDIRQLGLITEDADLFVPMTVDEEDDMFTFTFTVDQGAIKWEDLTKLGRNDKLRLLCNIARYKEYLPTRTTFFLHPDNLVFDDNLMPAIVYRGIRGVFPPYEMEEEKFLKQYKCLIIALFSKKYTFDQLYDGSLQNADETEFQRQVSEMDDLTHLIHFLEDSYKEEQKKTEATMQLVPTKRFRLFKRLSISMIIFSVVLAIPLAYILFWELPYQDKLQTSHHEYLASDYGDVISTLQGENPEELPFVNKYILAVSYINVETLSDDDRTVIMRNVSLNSDENYLMYWIYNGRGNLEESVDTAKYINDPQLIMHGLIQQIEQAQNDPELTGTQRDETVNELEQELADYREEYNLMPEEEETDNETVDEQEDTEADEAANNEEE
ncbi:type VII secretion protein EssB [Virgibacillus natechei]|uniref:Type VII secretion protein EssB n=1 Tax=Virgibacillus natechei TaxID=1216297 RepID=A0ABS4ICK3_9BACI|nr:type VII secretion protein EssB [Virgibacillus natechei]MBP1968673.1 type VII secretion protein EssB [Virgibacillus natechei]UZD13774.1 type VII secretion protein EssB [Virgibacillus natechei]